jgi:hypothetical protein
MRDAARTRQPPLSKTTAPARETMVEVSVQGRLALLEYYDTNRYDGATEPS